jgi:putative transposase
MRHGRCGHVF